MKKYLKSLRSNIRINKNLFVFLLVIVLVGIASGAIFSSILNENDSKMVSDYLNNFINNVGKSKIDFSIVISTSVSTMGLGLLIWIFGISIVGVILIIPIMFIKSFILGFSMGSIIVNFKLKGVLLSLLYIVPHQIINILIYILISAYGIIISTNLFRSMKNKKVFDFKKIMNRYTYILAFSLAVLFLTSVYEVYFLPKVIKLLINIIK